MPDRSAPAPNQVWQNEHFAVLVDAPAGVLWTVRSEKPFASLEELEVVMRELGRVLDGLGRARYALMADVRSAPGRNDPSFEEAMMRLRPLWMRGFRRVGVLVKSVVGLMQVQRFARQDGIRRMVSSDEAALLRYLTEEG